MALAIFDLDDTLVDGDSSSLWLNYQVAHGLAPADMLPHETELLRAYYAGQLAMEEYMDYTLMPLRGLAHGEVKKWVDRFIEEVIMPRIFPQALHQIELHRRRGDRLLVISATGEHLVSPIAERLGVSDAIGILLEMKEGAYTGKTHGVLSYREGKITRLRAWLEQQGETLAGSHGYSDSLNDIPLLEAVQYPHAVNPDATLQAEAQRQGWTELAWRREPLSA
ncbi:HAD family hydrolase [Pseudogulbenkiania subflava]|uniref:HAD-superfamily subfamily IB hydrolase, TIGR01490 n=1 Tax=Pseudogulbenkiania subflava DSM 22618 TaxID=1123014 RepID=A0A1Y6BZZ8_9NEIS|nr:HAD family hydrolase [Pseudogulbenkiania subflava]SMF38598.1 HAD-superfamily subfamily IB hydrolase, TIGR01490 [Pseudogulbenkiania subflava DSM 22618]